MSTGMEERRIRINPFKEKKEKRCMWPGKFRARASVKGYDSILEGTTKTPADNGVETKYQGFNTEPKKLNRYVYNDTTLSQIHTSCFQIVEESERKELPNGDARKAQGKVSKKFQPLTGASNTRLQKTPEKIKPKDATKGPED